MWNCQHHSHFRGVLWRNSIFYLFNLFQDDLDVLALAKSPQSIVFLGNSIPSSNWPIVRREDGPAPQSLHRWASQSLHTGSEMSCQPGGGESSMTSSARFGWGNLQIWLGNTFCETIKEWWFPAFPADFDFPGNSWLIASWFSIIYVLINHDFHEPEAQEVSPEGCFHTFCCQGSCLRLRLHQGRFGESSGFHQHQLHQLIDIHPSTFMTCLTCPTPQHLAGSSKNLRQKKHRSQKKNEVSNNAPLFLGISFRTSTRSGRPHQRGTASRAAARHRPAPPLPVPPRTEPPPPEALVPWQKWLDFVGQKLGIELIELRKYGEDWGRLMFSFTEGFQLLSKNMWKSGSTAIVLFDFTKVQAARLFQAHRMGPRLHRPRVVALKSPTSRTCAESGMASRTGFEVTFQYLNCQEKQLENLLTKVIYWAVTSSGWCYAGFNYRRCWAPVSPENVKRGPEIQPAVAVGWPRSKFDSRPPKGVHLKISCITHLYALISTFASGSCDGFRIIFQLSRTIVLTCFIPTCSTPSTLNNHEPGPCASPFILRKSPTNHPNSWCKDHRFDKNSPRKKKNSYKESQKLQTY